jgi:signal transduction histidine kinase
VSAESQAGRGDPPGRQSQRTQGLARDLRASASRAAERVGGGLALVFASAPGETSPESAARLRAAAGFACAQNARDTAALLTLKVHEVLESGEALAFEPPTELGERGAGSFVIHPVVSEDRAHGALAVGAPRSLEPADEEALADLASLIALRLDHARLAEEIEELRARTHAADEKNEEILKLSEALFAQDIELLRSHEKLGKIEKLKNDFIEKMSSELRTPLNSIIEAIISVLTGEHEALSETAKNSLRAALDDGTAFLRTLQNILDLWRIKQGELPVEIQEVNFREMVDEAIFSVQDSIGAKPVVVEQHIEEPFPKIRTDLAKINQIIFLLLDNAVKFTPRGKVQIRGRLEDGQLVCKVCDTGIGICSDDLELIFDEFYQVDELSSQRYRGAGLGLTLVRDLVVLLEGEIAVASEVGSGTTFTLTVPVQVIG